MGKVYLSYPGGISVFKQTDAPFHKPIRLTNATPAHVILLPSKQGDSIHIAGTYTDKGDNLGGVFKTTMTNFKLYNILLQFYS
ncbi:hypothetical protein [Chitinophaga sancti]|uniref:Uncharacterized protein n=1 Tax=Chitinophaga sancti TaxID=1004 RepID=A0ABZ0XF90_9BACT|nr:hypothetical protein [Chitinophaga sancti]WQD65448.1 hypothetical protein U0033_13695 [Chitinophaga sancti]WQG88929.1 hypothetical protein SR876_28775 [Chitinophaga sancti]